MQPMTARHYRIGKDVRSWGEREVFRDDLLADGSLVRIMNPALYQRALRAARHALRHAEPFRLIETDERAEPTQPLLMAEPLRMAPREPAMEPAPMATSWEPEETLRTAEPVEIAEPLPTAEAPHPAEPLQAAEPLPSADGPEPESVEHREESNRGGQSESRL
jgi:hypothetical protein